MHEPLLTVGNAQGSQEDAEQKGRLLKMSAVHHNMSVDGYRLIKWTTLCKSEASKQML